jgi:hypothetical protein
VSRTRRHSAIAIGGALAQRPGIGGHAWVFLQYLLGFRRLGWNVLFLDRLEPEFVAEHDIDFHVEYVRRTLEAFGLADAFSLSLDAGSRTIGLPRREAIARLRDSALLLNVMGYLVDEELLAGPEKRVFLDIDPGFPQMWFELGLADMLGGHDAFVTIAENMGQPDCAIPTCDRRWITTRPPVVLEHWPRHRALGGGFTSIATWRGPYAPVSYRGKTYGLRAHEFRRFAELPRLTAASLEVALAIDDADAADRELLLKNGWNLVDPRAVAGDPQAYRRYIQSSRAEFTVAKSIYVESNSGWFSDRSACYLASGRPVLAQETGLSRAYPTGEGLLTFRTLDQAAAGVDAIERDYERHANAARALAEDHFDSDQVLTKLLADLGVD